MEFLLLTIQRPDPSRVTNDGVRETVSVVAVNQLLYAIDSLDSASDDAILKRLHDPQVMFISFFNNPDGNPLDVFSLAAEQTLTNWHRRK